MNNVLSFGSNFKKGDKVRIKVKLIDKITTFLKTGLWCPKYGELKYYREEMMAWELTSGWLVTEKIIEKI